ncbi:MAG TPA: hypothetical protein VGI17_16290 [Solirubrobacterales bacterium]
MVEASGATAVELMAGSSGAPIGIAFAAAHPERVRRLVIYGGYAAGAASPTGTPSAAPSPCGSRRSPREGLRDGPFLGAATTAMYRDNLLWRPAESVEFAEDPLDLYPGLVASIDCPVPVAARRA